MKVGMQDVRFPLVDRFEAGLYILRIEDGKHVAR